MDTGFDENEAEFRVLVLAVGLEMFAHGDSLFDKVPKVFGDGWCKAWDPNREIELRTLILGGECNIQLMFEL